MAQVASKVKFDPLVADAGNRDQRPQMVPVGGTDSRLFEQLALGALTPALVRPAASGRNLPDGSSHRVPILMKHRNPLIAVKRDNRGGARMANDRQLDGQSVRQRDGLGAQVDDPGAKNRAAFGFHGSGKILAGGTGHRNPVRVCPMPREPFANGSSPSVGCAWGAALRGSPFRL